MEKPKVLLVDDEEFNLDALERLFRKNFNISRALSGKEALDLIKIEDFDVLLCDQRMPAMSGVEVLKESLTYLPDASRILLTGFTDLDSVIDSINKARIHMYLTKPWDNSQLLLSIEQASDAARMRKSIKEKNKELSLANENLKSLDKAKTHFMTMINHELKTPLTTISSYLQMLKEEVDKGLLNYVEGIEKGYDRLDKMIRLSLIIMEAKNSQLQLQVETIDLEKVYLETLKELQPLVSKRNLKVRKNFQADELKFDKKYFAIIFYELFENALRYSAEGEEVRIDFDGSVFSFSNKGELPKEKEAKIFQPYYVDESIMNHSNATGLGISVSQSILHAHGSQLNVDRDKGRVIFSFSV